MTTTATGTPDSYNPPGLLDAVRAKMNLKNDAELGRALKITPPVISKIRNGRIAVSAAMILLIYDTAQMSLAEIRSYLQRPEQAETLQ